MKKPRSLSGVDSLSAGSLTVVSGLLLAITLLARTLAHDYSKWGSQAFACRMRSLPCRQGDEHVPFLDDRSGCYVDGCDRPVRLGKDGNLHLHGLEKQQRVSCRDRGTDRGFDAKHVCDHLGSDFHPRSVA